MALISRAAISVMPLRPVDDTRRQLHNYYLLPFMVNKDFHNFAAKLVFDSRLLTNKINDEITVTVTSRVLLATIQVQVQVQVQ